MKMSEALTKLVVGAGSFGDHLLKKKVSGIAAAALAFACGAGLARAVGRGPAPERAAPPAASSGCASAGTFSATPPASDYVPVGDEYEYGDSPELQAWKNRNSGSPLPLGYARASGWGGPPESKVVVLPQGRTLASAGDTLYMLGGDSRILWRYEVPQAIFDFAHVGATGVVYGTAGDNFMFILDAETGRELARESRNGSAGFGRVIPYGDDACLVMDDYGGYRAGHTVGVLPMQDGVTAWRGTRMLWRRDVPPDAELQVVGPKIYAVTKTKDRILLQELRVPQGGR